MVYDPDGGETAGLFSDGMSIAHSMHGMQVHVAMIFVPRDSIPCSVRQRMGRLILQCTDTAMTVS